MPRSFLVKQRKICKQLKEEDFKRYSDEDCDEDSYECPQTPESKDISDVNYARSPKDVKKVKERKDDKEKTKDKETPFNEKFSSEPQTVHQLLQSGTTPVYVFSNNQPIRTEHVTTQCTIPVQYIHPNFCYQPYIQYENILPARIPPKEQIPPGMSAPNRIRNGKPDSSTLPLSIATNTVALTNGSVGTPPQILQRLVPSLVENGGKEKKYECHVCKSSFALQRLLNRHMKTHSFYKRYQCPYCDKGFNDTFDLKRHVRTHTGIKPFKCNLCDKAFTQRCSLEAHKTRVHGVVYQYGFRERRAKLYVCEDCGDTFQESSDYMKHLQEKHPESAAKTRLKRSLAKQNCQKIIAKTKSIEMDT